MISSVQKKIIIVFLLAINVTLPMEKLPWHNATTPNFCQSLVNVTMSMEKQLPIKEVAFLQGRDVENLMNVGFLVYGMWWLMWLKQRDRFFGTELIHNEEEGEYYFSSFSHLIFSAMFITHRQGNNNHLCMNSGIGNRGLFLLTVLSDMVHVSNLVHQNAVKLLKNSVKEWRTKLTIKNKLDITTINDAKCLTCWDNEPNKEYVNPCKQEDHIFCRKCLIRSFNQQTSKSSFVDGNSFFCEFCRKEVSFNDEKFEVELTKPKKPKVTLALWAKQVDIGHVVLYILGMYTLGVLSFCQFS